MSSTPYVFPANEQWHEGLSNAFDGLNDNPTLPGYAQQHAYTSDNSSNVPSTFGNAGGHFSEPQASYSYGSNQFPNDATTTSLRLPHGNMPHHQSNGGFPNYQNYQQSPSYSTDNNSHSTQYFPNNGAGYDHQSLFNNHIQSYARTPSQQFTLPTNGQMEERDATGQQYFLPPPPDATPPSPVAQSRDHTVHPAPPTPFHTQSLPVPANALSSSGAPAKPKGRQSKTTKPAPRARRAAPPAPTPSPVPVPYQELVLDVQGVSGNLDAPKAPVKRGRKKKTPPPQPSPATPTTAAVAQPVSVSINTSATYAASQSANKSKAAPAATFQVTPASNASVQSARSQSRPAVDTVVDAPKTSASLNKRKRDEQGDDMDRDRELMPPPPAPTFNVSNGKGKGKAAEPPAPVARNNQVNPNIGFSPINQTAESYNLSTIQFVLPSGLIALSPFVPPKDPASRGMVWIIDQTYAGIVWPAKLHTNEELADHAYRRAVKWSFQRIIYLPRRPVTDDGKVSISSLILISLGSPMPRNQVPFTAVNTARVIPPEQTSRFLEQLHFQEGCRRMMMFEESSSSFKRPLNPLMQKPSGQYPNVGGSSSSRQFSGVQQPASSHSPSLFPSPYPSCSTLNTRNQRFPPQERNGVQSAVQDPSTFSFESLGLPAAPTDGQSTAPQELPYPFSSSYPSATETAADPGSTSDSSTSPTGSTESAGNPSTTTPDVVDKIPDNMMALGEDFWKNLPTSDELNLEGLRDDDSQAPSGFHVDPNLLKGIMSLTDEQFAMLPPLDDDAEKNKKAYVGLLALGRTPFFDR